MLNSKGDRSRSVGEGKRLRWSVAGGQQVWSEYGRLFRQGHGCLDESPSDLSKFGVLDPFTAPLRGTHDCLFVVFSGVGDSMNCGVAEVLRWSPALHNPLNLIFPTGVVREALKFSQYRPQILVERDI